MRKATGSTMQEGYNTPLSPCGAGMKPLHVTWLWQSKAVGWRCRNRNSCIPNRGWLRRSESRTERFTDPGSGWNQSPDRKICWPSAYYLCNSRKRWSRKPNKPNKNSRSRKNDRRSEAIHRKNGDGEYNFYSGFGIYINCSLLSEQ